MPLVTKSNLRKVRFWSRAVGWNKRGRKGRLFNYALSKMPIADAIVNMLLQFNRPYKTIAEANEVMRQFNIAGHEHASNVSLHLALSANLRPSDYPAAFHLCRLAPELGSVFDLGGNVGNLYYLYNRHITFRPDLRWTVFDLPEIIEEGQRLANEREASRLHFTDNLDHCANVDLLVASGSSHYFDWRLDEFVRSLALRPEYILLNRTPLHEKEPVVLVQDAGDFMVPCKIHNISEMIEGFRTIGYECIDRWPVLELGFYNRAYPEYEVREYSGMMLRKTSS